MSNRKLNDPFAYVLLAVMISDVVISAVVLLTCGTRLKNGVVVDKWHEEARIESYTYYNFILKMRMSGTRLDDEDFVLIVKGFNGKDTVKQRFEVSKTDYENINIGDYVSFP